MSIFKENEQMARNYIAYYQKLGFADKPPATLSTLRTLHRNHMMTIPFENLDIHYGDRITLSPAAHYEKLVGNGRGGFCYEMNGLFFEAITALGFEAWRISVRVADGKGGFLQEFGHLAIVVSLDEKLYLCDVGFGESFIEPMLIQSKLKQPQGSKVYRMIKDINETFVVQYAAPEQKFKDHYSFTLDKRELDDFADMCIYHQESPNSTFTQKVLCSIATPEGRITLTRQSVIVTKNGIKDLRIIESEEAFFEELFLQFGILL